MNEKSDRLFDKKFTTEGQNSERDLIHFLKRSIRDTIDVIVQKTQGGVRDIADRIEAIGIAFAGPIDYSRATILDAPNFSVKNLPLGSIIEEAFSKPTHLDNDVNLGVLAEVLHGVGRGRRNVVGIIIGTGIGGGLVLNGQLYRGAGNTAGEVGHMVIDKDSVEQCGCGQFGCFEVLASRRAIARQVSRAKAARGEDGLQWREHNLISSDLALYYSQGDSDTVNAVMESATVCGKAAFSVLNLLNPELIFFSGGFLQEIGDAFLRPVRQEAEKCMNTIYELRGSKVPIVLGELKNPMLVGASVMALNGRTDSSTQVESFMKSFVGSITAREFEILSSIGGRPEGTAISPSPLGDFHEDVLRPLRNKGLVRTDEGKSFRKSRAVSITDLGKVALDLRGEYGQP
jgi:glucokinase